MDLTYDDRGRNTARTITRGTGVLGTTSETYAFDALDRMTEAVDNDVTVQLTWDSLGRKTSEKSGPNPISTYGKTTSYTYDAAGNVTSIDYPDGSFSVDRTYDDVNRLTLVEDGSAADIVGTDYYGAGGRLKKLTFGNTTTSTYGYDGFRWVASISHEDSNPTEFAGFDMVRDDVGNILTEEWSHDSGKGNVYTYDLAYRLTKALIRSVDPSAELASPGSQAYANKLEYNLSDDSDRTSLVLTPYGQSAVTTSYTSNNVHEYTVVGGISRVYDDNGNLIDDGTNDFEYDYRNQIVRVTRQSDSTVIGEYEYDALGRRTRKTLEDSSEVRYYHDGVHEIEEFDENGVLLRKFVYRDDIDSISMMEAPDQADVDGDTNTSELKRFYFHYDGRTNVSRLTDNDEQVVESYETDPYGAVSIKDKNGNPVTVSAVGNPFTFQRRRLDDETGLYYFRARHYDPVVGQWLQRDPLGYVDGGNLHEFVKSNPVANRDPCGMLTTADFAACDNTTSQEDCKECCDDIYKKLTDDVNKRESDNIDRAVKNYFKWPNAGAAIGGLSKIPGGKTPQGEVILTGSQIALLADLQETINKIKAMYAKEKAAIKAAYDACLDRCRRRCMPRKTLLQHFWGRVGGFE